MFLTLINRTYLNKLSSLINRKDKRSVRKWCSKNNLQIFKDSSGEFVNEAEFELAYNMPIIKKLKIKYGKEWLVYYDAYKKGELYKLLDLNKNIESKSINYQPKGTLTSKMFGGSSK